jgi:putative addiction module component (TIGR02574 family)
MSKLSAADVIQLEISERLRLVEEIWNSIAEVPQAVELTEEDKRLLEERLSAREHDADAGSPWEEVYKRIISRKK